MTAETSNARGTVDEAMVKRAAAAVMSAPPGISVEAYVRIALEAALATQHPGGRAAVDFAIAEAFKRMVPDDYKPVPDAPVPMEDCDDA